MSDEAETRVRRFVDAGCGGDGAPVPWEEIQEVLAELGHLRVAYAEQATRLVALATHLRAAPTPTEETPDES